MSVTDPSTNSRFLEADPSASDRSPDKRQISRGVPRCDKCGRDLSDDDPVWKVWSGYWRYTLCAACKPNRYFRPQQPCERCGRPVHECDVKAPSIVYCGPRCQALIYWARSNAKRDRRRPPREAQIYDHICWKCGSGFTALRRWGVRYCSRKCRQAHGRALRGPR